MVNVKNMDDRNPPGFKELYHLKQETSDISVINYNEKYLNIVFFFVITEINMK